MDPLLWHKVMCGFAANNILIWLWLVSQYPLTTQLLLSGVFTFGCAFRSFFPQTDLEQYGIVDSTFSRVIISRTIATVAEMAFILQLGLYYNFVYPLFMIISLAEFFSWYAIIKNIPFYNFLENSLWALSAFVLLFKATTLIEYVFIFNYITFMIVKDLPMYIYKSYDYHPEKSIYTGFKDLIKKSKVNLDSLFWSNEIPWMTGYFTFGVWISMFLVCKN